MEINAVKTVKVNAQTLKLHIAALTGAEGVRVEGTVMQKED